MQPCRPRARQGAKGPCTQAVTKALRSEKTLHFMPRPAIQHPTVSDHSSRSVPAIALLPPPQLRHSFLVLTGCSSVEEAQHLASHPLAARLLVVHDALQHERGASGSWSAPTHTSWRKHVLVACSFNQNVHAHQHSAPTRRGKAVVLSRNAMVTILSCAPQAGATLPLACHCHLACHISCHPGLISQNCLISSLYLDTPCCPRQQPDPTHMCCPPCPARSPCLMRQASI